LYLLKLKMCQVIYGINETENQIGASQAHYEIVAWLSQIRMPHDGPVIRTFIPLTTKNVLRIRLRRSQGSLWGNSSLKKNKIGEHQKPDQIEKRQQI